MILSIGEILVDVFNDGKTETVFPGGAPFNVAANIASFGGDVLFCGAIGKDEYGSFLKQYISNISLNSNIEELKDKDTTIAKVTLKDGERSFAFIRDNGADYHLSLSSIENIKLPNKVIVHIGSLMLSYKEGFDFFFKALEYYKNKGHLISFDVNYRDDIFSDTETAKKIFITCLSKADIIKFTDDELRLLANESDLEIALKRLTNPHQIVVVSLGKNGSMLSYNNRIIKVPSNEVKPIDTTGAGDAFYSYFLYELDKGLNLDDDKEIYKALRKANFVGAMATLKKGAVGVVPSKEEIDKFEI